MAPQETSLPPLTLTPSAAVCVGSGVGLCVGAGVGLGLGCCVGALVEGAGAWLVAACVVGCAAGRLDDGAEECGAVLAADADADGDGDDDDDEVAS